MAFAGGLAGFLVVREYERSVTRRLASVSPVPDSSLAEAALLSDANPAARQYRDLLRAQKREMTLAEFEAVKKLVTAMPVNTSREALYG